MNFALQHSRTKRQSLNPRRCEGRSAHPRAHPYSGGYISRPQSTRRITYVLQREARRNRLTAGCLCNALTGNAAHHHIHQVPFSSTVGSCGVTAETWARFTPAFSDDDHSLTPAPLRRQVWVSVWQPAVLTCTEGELTRAFAEEMPIALLVAHRLTPDCFAKVERAPGQYSCAHNKQSAFIPRQGWGRTQRGAARRGVLCMHCVAPRARLTGDRTECVSRRPLGQKSDELFL